MTQSTANEDVQNIGRLNYLWTILTGKNRQFYEFEDLKFADGLDDLVEKGLVSQDSIIRGDIVVTIGKKAVIVTCSVPWLLNSKRGPIVVKRWREIKESTSSSEQQFVDSDGNRWIYYRNKTQLECIDTNGNIVYKFR